MISSRNLLLFVAFYVVTWYRRKVFSVGWLAILRRKRLPTSSGESSVIVTRFGDRVSQTAQRHILVCREALLILCAVLMCGEFRGL
jgi:hypothetical protein